LDRLQPVQDSVAGEVVVGDGEDAGLVGDQQRFARELGDLEGHRVVRRQDVDVAADDAHAQGHDPVECACGWLVDGPTCHRGPLLVSASGNTICRDGASLKICREIPGKSPTSPPGVPYPGPGTA